MPLDPSVIPPQPRENEPADAVRESAETLALLARRRSTKIAHLSEPGPTGAALNALIQLAARVPDHGKLGPWRFVIIEGDARARAGAAIAHVIENDVNVDQSHLDAARGLFLRAPTCVMIVSSPVESKKVPEWEQQMSAGAASFALLLSAHAMGYAGCWLTEWPAFDGRARAALGLAEDERVAGFVYLGTAREPATERIRADAASRISHF
jgi:nitroreductase